MPTLNDLQDHVQSWAEKEHNTKFPGSDPTQLEFVIRWPQNCVTHEPAEFCDIDWGSVPNAKILNQQTFENKSGSQPSYHAFQVERKSRASANVQQKSGYRFHDGLQVSIPGKVSESSPFSNGFKVTSEKKTFHEESSWSVKTDIKVLPRKRSMAQLVIQEEKWSGNYTVTTRVKGKVHVKVEDLNENIVHRFEGDLIDIITPLAGTNRSILIADDHVKLKSKGQLDLKYGVEQNVKVTEEELEVEERSRILACSRRRVVEKFRIPHSLGVGIYRGKMAKCMEKGYPIPHEETHNFTTVYDYQNEGYIPIYEGEDPIANRNHRIGEFTLKGIQMACKGVPQIDVTFTVDMNGLLTVSAKERYASANVKIHGIQLERYEVIETSE